MKRNKRWNRTGAKTQRNLKSLFFRVSSASLRLCGSSVLFLALFGLASADEGSRAARQLPTAPVSPKAKAPVMEAGHVELERLKRPAPAAKLEAEAAKEPGKDAAAAKEPEKEFHGAFAPTSWYVPPPPPPPPKPEPPPKPTAPPLPFTYLGRYDEGDTAEVVMLLKGDRIYTVSEGEVIDNTYRVEKVAPGAVELIYLPLNIKQSLRTG